MGRCVRCGRKGLFLRVDINGYCSKCAEEVRIEQQEKQRLEKELALKQASQRVQAIPEYSIVLSSDKRKRQSGYEPVKTSNITPKGKYDRFVVFDTETTGLAPSKDRIIELGAVRFVDGEPIERFRTLVNPERPIPEEATEINNITDDMVINAPTIVQVLPSFEEFIGKDLLIGHNLEFDLKFIYYSGSLLFETKRKYIDTLEQARKLLKGPKRRKNAYDDYDLAYDDYDYSKKLDYADYDYYDDYDDYDVDDYKLDTLCDYYQIIRTNIHRADLDALATGDLFLNLVSEKQG